MIVEQTPEHVEGQRFSQLADHLFSAGDNPYEKTENNLRNAKNATDSSDRFLSFINRPTLSQAIGSGVDVWPSDLEVPCPADMTDALLVILLIRAQTGDAGHLAATQARSCSFNKHTQNC